MANILATALQKMPEGRRVEVGAIYDPVAFRRMSLSRALTAGKDSPVTEAASSFEELITAKNRLDAVIIASPDHLHAVQAIAAMEAGLHVYCEAPLAHTLEGARAMIAAQRKTGKLLQAGYQRRSNPRYRQLRNDVIRKRELMGRLTRAYSQWNRSQKQLIQPKISARDEEAIKAAGYADRTEWANWRNYRKFSMGVAHTMGGYAVNAVTWMLGALPDRVLASGGTDYYDGKEGRPLYENVDNFSAVFGFTSGDHTLRYNCNVNLDTDSGGYFEKVMGLQGWAIISEQPLYGNEVIRNPEEPWETFEQATRDGVIKQLWSSIPLTESSRVAETVDAHSRPTDVNIPYYQLAIQDPLRPHTYHLENFLSVLRSGGPQSNLSCPAEEAWKTLVCMSKLQEAIDTRREVLITAADYAA